MNITCPSHHAHFSTGMAISSVPKEVQNAPTMLMMSRRVIWIEV